MKIKKKVILAIALTLTEVLLYSIPVMAAVAETYTPQTWVQDTGSWYYYDEQGTLARSRWIVSPYSGKWYYLYADGHMAANTITPDGYYVDGDGAWDGKSAGQSDASAQAYADEKSEIINLVNAERAKEGCSSLSYDSTLAAYAQTRAEEMLSSGLFSHTRPSGQSALEYTSGYFMTSGENIAYTGGYMGSANQVMTMWMNSPGHRANILLGDYDSIGIGIASDGNQAYFVQSFGGSKK